MKESIIFVSNLNFLKETKKCMMFFKIRVGWIDINNLMAKVPLVGGSIYVKVLKVKSNSLNRMFNIEKLAKVGILASNTLKQNSINTKTVPVSRIN